jgi:hypothetical protein
MNSGERDMFTLSMSVLIRTYPEMVKRLEVTNTLYFAMM